MGDRRRHPQKPVSPIGPNRKPIPLETMNTTTLRHPLTLALTSLTSIAAIIALSLSVSLSGQASESPAKGAVRLVSMHGAPAPRSSAQPGKAQPFHSDCGSCQTVTTTKTSNSARGAEVLTAGGKPVYTVASHGCGSCTTSSQVTGHGKMATTKSVHACTVATVASVGCCK